MKNITLLCLLCLAMATSFGQTYNPKYDSLLAKKLNANEYGMKSYVLVILKTGSNTQNDKHFTDSCFKGHMKNIERMASLKKLIVAGPMKKNDKTYRGIFILDVATFEEAQALIQLDDAIQANLLEPEFYTWYGSAALPEYLEASEKVWKKRN